MIAFTRPVPPSLAECELTHLERQPIDVARASRQHDAYEVLLRALGCEVMRLPALPNHPDSVFIEDTAIVLDECAVIARPGATSRRGEVDAVAEALKPLRRLYHVEAPGTLDGGDVLCLGRHVYVGMSSRSNEDGARQLADAIGPMGYTVKRVPMRDCLHLKTAATALPDGSLLINPAWVDGDAFDGARILDVHPEEGAGANVLTVGNVVVAPASAPRTHDRLVRSGFEAVTLDASELARAEGGLTCCSLLVGALAPPASPPYVLR